MNLKKIYKDITNNFNESISLYESMIYFKFDDINFEIYDYNHIIAYDSKNDYTQQLQIIIHENIDKMNLVNIPSCVIKILLADLDSTAGFIEDKDIDEEEREEVKVEKRINISYFYESMKLLADKEREIEIESFGENHKSFLEFCKTFDATFSALHLGMRRPRGVNLKVLRGTNEIIQNVVENSSGYQYLIENIVKEVESHNYKKIGIFCHFGRHRSVAITELLKKNLYPNARVKHLHINK